MPFSYFCMRILRHKESRWVDIFTACWNYVRINGSTFDNYANYAIISWFCLCQSLRASYIRYDKPILVGLYSYISFSFFIFKGLAAEIFFAKRFSRTFSYKATGSRTTTSSYWSWCKHWIPGRSFGWSAFHKKWGSYHSLISPLTLKTFNIIIFLNVLNIFFGI